MIEIKDIASLKEALTTDSQSGLFVKPLKEFIKEGIVMDSGTRPEYRYPLDEDANEILLFQVKKSVITFKSYMKKINENYQYHRSNDLPATITYNDNGYPFFYQWFIEGYKCRDNVMKPITVENNGDEFWHFKYQYDISETHLLAVANITYIHSKRQDKLRDIAIECNGTYIDYNLEKAKRMVPEIDDIKFEDCFDLSKNIFTEDYITVIEMANI
jgi:hypothetical protein